MVWGYREEVRLRITATDEYNRRKAFLTTDYPDITDEVWEKFTTAEARPGGERTKHRMHGSQVIAAARLDKGRSLINPCDPRNPWSNGLDQARGQKA